jgi:hypothetical protein
MTAPTPRVRTLTFERDGFRCVSCGAWSELEWHHREASGMGGHGRKQPELTPADGLIACHSCNARYEADLQTLALARGWKLRRNRCVQSFQVPFFNRNTNTWKLPDTKGGATEIESARAQMIIDAAGGATHKVTGVMKGAA